MMRGAACLVILLSLAFSGTRLAGGAPPEAPSAPAPTPKVPSPQTPPAKPEPAPKAAPAEKPKEPAKPQPAPKPIPPQPAPPATPEPPPKAPPPEKPQLPPKLRTSFAEDVMPLVNRLGCNTVACHAAAKGKGGLRLSMFGADPRFDYDAIVRMAKGRRIDRLQPARSLFLQKAVGELSHGGGKRLDVASPEYGILLAWLNDGAGMVDPSRPRVVSVRIVPEEQALEKGRSAALKAMAVFSDGSQKDVTRLAVFRSADVQVAPVDAGGNVKAEGTGQAAIVATYLRRSGVARIVVPQKLSVAFPEIAPNNKVDELVFAHLKKLGLPPSGVCSDEVFVRRVCLDLVGALPAPAEVRAFLDDKAPDKRVKLIDRLMAREDFADCWALKWGDLLRIKSEFPVRIWPKAAHTYYRWVRQSLLDNKPYDQFVRELVTASGSNFRCGNVNFFRANPIKDPQTIAESAALIFMGVRMGCARCHGHPTEDWTLDDNLGLAAFFGKVAFKPTQEWKEEIVYVNRKAALRHPQTKELVKPKYLGGESLEVAERDDPREKFADWLIRPENPYFARNIVNRAWFWFLGRGIVHEPDDLRPTNLPSNPELLAMLEKDFVANKYDLRHLFRLILSSKTYQLSSAPNEWNKDDAVHFSHFQIRRLTAEQLLDAIGQVTETSEPFASPIPEPYTQLPKGYRAVQLYDGDITAPFLELFGRAPRDTPYECERNLHTSLRQALHVINSDHVQNRIYSSPRLQRWFKDKKSDEDILDELYMIALCRAPKPEEKQKLLEFISQAKNQRVQAVQDAVWMVLNTKEFLFNH
jgi:hypothetical protein